MKMAADFIPLHVLLLVVAVRIYSLAERPSCNSTFTSFQDLQAAINQTETSHGADYVLCVNLQPGSVEYIGYSSTAFDSVSLIITGSSQGAGSYISYAAPVVKCREPKDYSVSGELSLNEYPLVVTNSTLVIIEGVQFEDCMRPLQFNQIRRVELRQSIFRNFNPGGAIDIFKCRQIVVSNCIFSNNTNLGIGNRSYSGNAGGMAIGYDENNEPDYHPDITITDSIIEYNRADGSSNFQREASLLLKRRVFKQRGGGIAFYFGTRSSRARIEILRSSFVGNFARSAGGGLYINLLGENSSHIINIHDCNFTSNSAFIGAGMVTFYNPVINNFVSPIEILAHTVSIVDCTFAINAGQYGGAVSNIQLGYLNTLYVKNCTFVENNGTLGAALYLQFLFTTFSFVPERKIIVEDCMFWGNIARNGALFATRNTVRILGDTFFRGNTGPSIQALSSLIRLGGHVVFECNRDHLSGNSGVIYLSAFGQILLEASVDILFRNNTGREGASIVVVGQSLSADLAEQLYNPQCFLQYVIPTAPPPTWKVNLSFEDNQAIVGPVVYMSGVSACIWNSTSSPFFSYNLQDIHKVWRFMNMGNNFILRGAVGINEPDYYIQTTVQYLVVSSQDNSIFGSPGESIAVEIDALDELMHNTSAFLQVETADSSVTFVPSVVQTVAGVGEVDFMYLSDNTNGNTTVQIIPSFTASDVESLDSDATLTLVHEPCLPGYFRMNKRCICEEDDVIVLCEPEDKGLLLADGLWGNFSTLDRKLVTHVCPPGYCDCEQSFQNGSDDVGCLLEYSDPSAICDKTRTGMFCGKCSEGGGVGLLTNHCRSFSDKLPQFWIFLIYLVVLVPLLVAIVKLGIHLPTVLRGLIFYVQISPIAVEFLPQSFKLKTDPMLFIGSAFGLYIPYDFSFHKGMTSLESHGLRYVAPLIALIVVPFAVRFRHPHSKYWYGVWTIIQLMYIMSVRTSVSLLLCPRLIGTRVWFYDGTVQCYHGWHILLAVVALLSLLTLILLVFLIAAALKFKLLRRKVHHWFAKLEPFSIALMKGIKKDCWWWPIVDLTCKYTLVLSVVYVEGQKVLALVNVLVLLFVQYFVHPYKNKLANYLESFALLVLIVPLGLGNTPTFVEAAVGTSVMLWPLFYLPVFAEIIIITAYVGYILCWKKLQGQLSARTKKKADPNRRSTRIVKRLENPTQSEISIHDLHEDNIDTEFTLWAESTDM